MKYQSSRGKCDPVSAPEAIKMGIAPDGGLFVPDFIPVINDQIMQEMQGQSYQDRAGRILSYFLEEFSDQEIRECVNKAYNSQNFDDERIAPLIELNERLYIQELWHGPTCAFKDMALQMLPHLLTVSTAKTGENSEIIILVATSGDTGKAALEGFRDVPGTRIVVFFPNEGVSEVQKRQMITQEGRNVFTSAVEGNFDDTQTGVKMIFADTSIANRLSLHNMKMSSANSINWGRLLPQIVYYVSAYVDLKSAGKVKDGEQINIVVPTGNFGNILAAFYAGKMGVPIHKLICASNANNVLTEFIRSGSYDRNREFARTISPSMDILISSNLERLLYEITDHNDKAVSDWMEELKVKGYYHIDEVSRTRIKDLFWADYASDEDTLATISSCWEHDRYMLDTHTAVAKNIYDRYLQSTGDNTASIIVSTASPFKFGKSVAQTILKPEMIRNQDEFEILKVLSDYTGIAIPAGIKDLETKAILHRTMSSKENMAQTLLDYLKI